MRDELRAELAESELRRRDDERWQEQRRTNSINRWLSVGAFLFAAVNIVITLLKAK